MEDKQEKKSVNYSHIVRRMEGLRASQKLLLYHLASAANRAGESWYSIKTIMAQTGMAYKTIEQAKAELEKRGLVRCHSGRQEGKPNHYHLQLEAMRKLIPEGHVKSHEGVVSKDMTPAIGVVSNDRRGSCQIARGGSVKRHDEVTREAHSEESKIKNQGTSKAASHAGALPGGFTNGILDELGDRTLGTPTPHPDIPSATLAPAPRASRPAWVEESMKETAPVKLSGNAPNGRPWSEWHPSA